MNETTTVATPAGALRPKMDGRALRAARTRERIIGATVQLIRRGEATPRVIDIARTAGVSTRSIFQHFDDTEALFIAVAQQVVDQLLALTPAVNVTLPWEERLEALIQSRVQLNEALLPFRRAVALHQPSSIRLAAKATAGRMFTRERTEAAFSELALLSEAERKITLDAVVAASDWQMWFGLRTTYAMDLDTAAATMRRMIQAILTQAFSGTARASSEAA